MPLTDNFEPVVQEHITIDILLNSPLLRMPLKQVNGEYSRDNRITDKNVHRPQLALAGYVELFTYHRIQIFGNTEMYYLKSLERDKRIQAFTNIAKFDIPCIILTNNHTIDDELAAIACERSIPILSTSLETTEAILLLSEFLDTQFAEQIVVHGSFVDVYGVGILFMGRSGIGKSEITLDLVERGHRLVADDAVTITKKRQNILIGAGAQIAKHFMEVRGLGLIDVRQMFGVRAIRFQKRLEIVVELEEWDRNAEYTRTGLDDLTVSVMGVEIFLVKLPIFPGKNITVIAETIALNYLLKMYGYDAAKEFSKRLEAEIQRKSGSVKPSSQGRMIPYFDTDFE